MSFYRPGSYHNGGGIYTSQGYGFLPTPYAECPAPLPVPSYYVEYPASPYAGHPAYPYPYICPYPYAECPAPLPIPTYGYPGGFYPGYVQWENQEAENQEWEVEPPQCLTLVPPVPLVPLVPLAPLACPVERLAHEERLAPSACPVERQTPEERLACPEECPVERQAPEERLTPVAHEERPACPVELQAPAERPERPVLICARLEIAKKDPQERFRLDRLQLARLDKASFYDIAQGLKRTEAVVYSKHCEDRVRKYKRQGERMALCRQRTADEPYLTAAEAAKSSPHCLLQLMRKWAENPDSADCQILVEIGLCQNRRVVKLAFATEIAPQRFLFWCALLNGTIKTMYVTDGFKEGGRAVSEECASEASRYMSKYSEITYVTADMLPKRK